ncbi:MAG: DUF1015 family protein [Clostridiales bacterium]|jgi:uncharacterized protein (DUF1015 family)|nr:DUF1015 family protein [Clostridiales bacterium]
MIIKPFKAIRPRKGLAEKIAALPYDVMSSSEAREIAKNNPYSFLHIDKAEIDLDESIDIYDAAVYKKAKSNLEKFIADGSLISDPEEYFYIYRLGMDGRSQTGLAVCTSVDEYINGKIKKHEHTREDKELDRINHVDICDANTGPIFLAYKAEGGISALINNYAGTHEKEYSFVSDDGVSHEVWVINDSAAINELTGLFKAVPNFYIADGHHRNASAVKVALKRRSNSCPGNEYNYYLSVLFPDNELYIMDYNRAIKDLNGLTEEGFIHKVKASFFVEPAAGQYKPEKPHTFGMFLNQKWYKLTAKENIIPTGSVSGLDVSILQDNLLGPILGIDDPRSSKRADFIGGRRGLGELERRVNNGEMAVAFSMYPTSIKELFDIADAGEIMPPKSTWFEPKLRSGLFIHKLS